MQERMCWDANVPGVDDYGEGKPLFSKQMKLCTWALAKVAEYPTLQHSDITCDPLR